MDPGAATNPRDPLLGRTIAEKFRIESLVGRGAMGAVYRATQLNLKKRIAIKVMHPEKQGKKDATYASRFKREAKAASRMDHPNLMRVIDFGEEPDGMLYIAMEYLEGRDLLRVLREEYPLTTPRIVSIISQTLAALAAAHEMGVVHRDLKPENIMLLASKDDEGNPTELVKVCDFGVAKIVHDHVVDMSTDDQAENTRTATQTGTLTAYGTLIGTPEYMSPEQARGEPADHRSDLYSLGVILFLMLAGRLPFDAKSKIRLVLKHVEELPPQPSEFESKIDLNLEAICMRALEKRPQDRYQSAREMRAEVKAVLDGRVQSIPPPPRREKLARPQTPPPFTPVQGSPAHAAQSARPTPYPQQPPPDRYAYAQPPPSQPPRSRPAEIFGAQPTSTIQDPLEAKEALQEVRKRLGTHPPSVPPPPNSQPPKVIVPVTATTTRPMAGATQAGLLRIVAAIIVILLVAIAVLLALR